MPARIIITLEDYESPWGDIDIADQTDDILNVLEEHEFDFPYEVRVETD